MTEAEVVFTQLLECNRQELYARRNMRLGKDTSLAVAGMFKRRITGEPLEYILGETEFMGFMLKVTPDVLIPRQETEILVETVLRLVSSVSVSKCQAPHSGVPLDPIFVRECSGVKILDVGTGSGCIAVSLAKFLPDAQITALDISEEALNVARANARLHKVKINFLQSDLFSHDALRTTQFDVIISNPPYIPTGDIASLQREIHYEPRIALDAGKDGLDFFRCLINQSSDSLISSGFLVMELGFGQKEAVKNLIQKSGNFEIIDTIKDYGGIERVMVCRKYG